MWDVEWILKGSSFYIMVIGIVFGILSIVILSSLVYRYKRRIKLEANGQEKLQEQVEQMKQQKKELEMEKEELEKKYHSLKETAEHLEKEVYVDYLTELPNRKALMEILDSAIKTLRKDETVILMALDLDDFKKVNDMTGSMYGDQLLMDVGYRLREALGENDFLARLEGDEFAVLTQNITDMQEYDKMLKRLHRIFSYPFLIGTREIFLSVSMGIALAPKDGTTMAGLMKHTAAALVAAKESGKNTYVYFNESMNEQGKRRLELQAELRMALTEEQFLLQYQPIFELNSRKLLGFEALIRWNHPELGLLEPQEFLFVAEESGLIVSIGRQIFAKVCKKMTEWSKAGFYGIKMAVNFSSREFRDPDFIEKIREIFFTTKADPKDFIFEISESTVSSYLTESIIRIQELKQLGVSLALDNFGTGKSSFNDLKQLPVNMLKIDPRMIKAMVTQEREQIILKTILSLARELHLVVIAEGVEEIIQEEFLKAHFCTAVQGYLYEMPLDEERAEELLIKGQHKK